VALQLVRDRERDLGTRRVAQPREARERDDVFLLAAAAERADQRAMVLPVGVEKRLDSRRRQRRKAVKAPVDTLLGQAPEKGEDGVGIACLGRAKPQGAAVPEDDVTDVRGVDGHHRQSRQRTAALPSERARRRLRQITEQTAPSLSAVP
jgi:hypothetical protein